MASKTISVTEEVYKLLARMKLPGESFSQAIKRLVRRSRISECAGLWSDMPDDELAGLIERIQLLRERATNALAGKDEP